VGVDFGILILILNTEREIAVKGEIELFNLIITSEPLYLMDTKINERRD